MNSKLVNLRLKDDHIRALDTLAGSSLNRQAVARMLLIAAIESVERSQGALTFPVKLDVCHVKQKQRFEGKTGLPTQTR